MIISNPLSKVHLENYDADSMLMLLKSTKIYCILAH